MKKLLIAFLCLVLFSGCSKARRTYQIVVEKDNSYPVEVKVDDQTYRFEEASFTTEVEIGKTDAVLVWVEYRGDDDWIKIIIKKEGQVLNDVLGYGYASAIITRDNIEGDGGSYYSSGSSAGTTCYCGAPTLDGTPCERKVTCGTGYCWQHD